MAMLGGAFAVLPVVAEPREPTRIEIDQAGEAIYFIVGGVPVGRLVSAGLVVIGDISFDGQLTDRDAAR